MGVGLAKKAYAYAVGVPLHHNEHRLLVYMALTALDGDSPPRYFDSRESSAIALGYLLPDAGESPAGDRMRASKFESVRRALQGLVALGAIDRIVEARAGRRAEYAIRLDTARTRSSSEYAARQRNVAPQAQRNVAPQAQRNVAPQAQHDVAPQAQHDVAPQAQHDVAPKEQQRNTEEQERGITSVNGTVSSAWSTAANLREIAHAQYRVDLAEVRTAVAASGRAITERQAFDYVRQVIRDDRPPLVHARQHVLDAIHRSDARLPADEPELVA